MPPLSPLLETQSERLPISRFRCDQWSMKASHAKLDLGARAPQRYSSDSHSSSRCAFQWSEGVLTLVAPWITALPGSSVHGIDLYTPGVRATSCSSVTGTLFSLSRWRHWGSKKWCRLLWRGSRGQSQIEFQFPTPVPTHAFAEIPDDERVTLRVCLFYISF